jgi:surface polysaccharide O-acyltransferase-like enzyme
MKKNSHVKSKLISTARNNFNYSIENFRAIAILFVVFSHTDLSTLGSMELPASFILSDATTFFVFISGFLFYYLSSENFNFRSYLSKKFKFVATPYLFLSIITISTGFYIGQNDTFDLKPAAYVAWSLWVGGAINPPMWFIPMIWCLFLTAPILIKIAKSKFLPAVLIISILFSLFSNRPLLNTNPILSSLHFLGFYMMGMYCAKGSDLCKQLEHNDAKKIYPFIFLTAFSFIAYIDQAHISASGFFSGTFKPNFIQIGKFFLLITIYWATTKYLHKKNNFLSYIADISFGMFFLHGLWRIVADKAITYLSINRPVLILITELTVMIVGSILCIEVVRKIMKNRSRYVIGC